MSYTRLRVKLENREETAFTTEAQRTQRKRKNSNGEETAKRRENQRRKT
jgi:hypothetical protein